MVFQSQPRLDAPFGEEMRQGEYKTTFYIISFLLHFTFAT